MGQERTRFQYVCRHGTDADFVDKRDSVPVVGYSYLGAGLVGMEVRELEYTLKRRGERCRDWWYQAGGAVLCEMLVRLALGGALRSLVWLTVNLRQSPWLR